MEAEKEEKKQKAKQKAIERAAMEEGERKAAEAEDKKAKEQLAKEQLAKDRKVKATCYRGVDEHFTKKVESSSFSSHNCNLCGEEGFEIDGIVRCGEHDFDVCLDCKKKSLADHKKGTVPCTKC